MESRAELRHRPITSYGQKVQSNRITSRQSSHTTWHPIHQMDSSSCGDSLVHKIQAKWPTVKVRVNKVWWEQISLMTSRMAKLTKYKISLSIWVPQHMSSYKENIRRKPACQKYQRVNSRARNKSRRITAWSRDLRGKTTTKIHFTLAAASIMRPGARASLDRSPCNSSHKWVEVEYHW